MGQADRVTGVDVVEVRSEGLVGYLCCPPNRAGPGVVALGGSEGGFPLHLARLLAQDGFCCLALGYFGAPGLPRNLVNIPVEYIKSGLDWLGCQPSVAGDRIGLIGASKGAELALLSASMFPESVAAVVAYAPSCAVFAGISFGREGRRKSSWSYQGQPLPFIPYPRPMRPSLGLRGLSQVGMYQRALDEADAATALSAAIQARNIDAAVLLLSGGKDRMWPASDMAETVVARMAAAGKVDRAEHLHFAEAGHSFMPWAPNLSSSLAIRAINGARLAGFGGLYELGGRPAANRQALRQGWERVVPFLKRHLSPPPTSDGVGPDA